MHSLITVLTLLVSIAICIRLLTYHPLHEGHHYRGASWCAWLLVASTGGLALHIVIAGKASQVSVWQLGLLIVLAVLTYRAQGNVARLLRRP